jgi:hypothetical protein
MSGVPHERTVRRMTTERSSFQDPGGDPGMTGDDTLGANVDALVGTREDEMTSTGLSDTAFPSGASTSSAATGTAGRDTDWATGSTGSTGTSGSGDRLQEAAGSVADRVTGTAQQQIGTRANTQLSKAGDMLGQVAGAIRQSGEQMRGEQPQIASFADTAAQQVDKASNFLRQSDFNGLVREAEDFARRQPAVFLGGALALGLVASRFLKASPQGGQGGRGYGSYGSYDYGSSYGSSYGRSTGFGAGDRYGTRYGDQAGVGGYGGGSGYSSSTDDMTGTGSMTSGMAGGSGSGVMDTDEGAEHGRV